jgi:CheY-like chemotaxis protein
MSTVLVVDDDPAVIAVVSAQLQLLGHHVVSAQHPAKAIGMLDRGMQPELAVLDISMPEMTGFELAQILHMREETSRVPVVFLSSTLDAGAAFTDDEGVTARYIPKESVAEALPAAIRDLLPAQRSD